MSALSYAVPVTENDLIIRENIPTKKLKNKTGEKLIYKADSQWNIKLMLVHATMLVRPAQLLVKWIY